jgi:hypothetical protein
MKSLDGAKIFDIPPIYFPFIVEPDPIMTRVFFSFDPEKGFAQFRRFLLGDARHCPSQMMLFYYNL